MSHKIYNSKAAKQQAYRDRIEKARVAAAKAVLCLLGSNIGLPLRSSRICEGSTNRRQTPPALPASPLKTP